MDNIIEKAKNLQNFLANNDIHPKVTNKMEEIVKKLEAGKYRNQTGKLTMTLRPKIHKENEYKEGFIFNKRCRLIYYIRIDKKKPKNQSQKILTSKKYRIRNKRKDPKREGDEQLVLNENDNTGKKRVLYSSKRWIDSDEFKNSFRSN